MPIWDDEQDLPASQMQSIAQWVCVGAALFDLALTEDDHLDLLTWPRAAASRGPTAWPR